MMGAEIKFIIIETDKISSKAVGARIKAINIKKQKLEIKFMLKLQVYGKSL